MVSLRSTKPTRPTKTNGVRIVAMASSSEPIPFRPRHVSPRLQPPPPRPRRQPRGLPPAPGEPTDVQRSWLRRGLSQPGGKLPLFDEAGTRVDPRTVRSCVENGWAEPWFQNPLKADWLICRLTDKGRALVSGD
jgi:hypothetical protein